MSRPGAPDLLAQARSALLDALEALRQHRDAVVVVGAQAVYLHTGQADVALAEATKDSDLALDTRLLSGDPLIEQAMRDGGFHLDLVKGDPGAWLHASGIPVDVMVPEALAGAAARNRRGGRIPPHARTATRRAVGLEATIVDRAPMEVAALVEGDERRFTANVAGPAGLLVAKLHKLGERDSGSPGRLVDKDAHDVYRLFVAVPTEALAATLARLAADPLAGLVTQQAMVYLRELFATGPDATGSVMAGRAEEGIGQPETVAASVTVLAEDLLLALAHD